MKNLFALMLLITTIALANSIASAEENHEPKDGPCKKVREACKSANFAKGDRSLFKDCVQPLLAGDPVPGVKLDQSIIAACKKIKDSKQKTK